MNKIQDIIRFEKFAHWVQDIKFEKFAHWVLPNATHFKRVLHNQTSEHVQSKVPFLTVRTGISMSQIFLLALQRP